MSISEGLGGASVLEGTFSACAFTLNVLHLLCFKLQFPSGNTVELMQSHRRRRRRRRARRSAVVVVVVVVRALAESGGRRI